MASAADLSTLDVVRTPTHQIHVIPGNEAKDPPHKLEITASGSTPSANLNKQLQGRSVLVVVSTLSGAQHAPHVYHHLVKPYLDHFHIPHTTHFSTSAESIRDLTASTILPAALASQKQAVLLLSGDGGILDLLSILTPQSAADARFTPPLVGLFPLGTGNALANSSHILHPSDATWGLRTLALGEPRPLPLLDVTFSPPAKRTTQGAVVERDVTHTSSAVVVSWALHAALVADSDTPEYRTLGTARFQMAAKENLFPPDGGKPHAYSGKLSLLKDGQWQTVDREKHNYVLGTMCSQLEAGFTVSPESRPLDGRLKIVYIGAVDGGGGEIMEAMTLAYQKGGHVRLEGVGYEDVEGFRLEVDEEDERWRRVCVDGTIFVMEKGGRLEVRRSEKRVLELLHIERD